jgi:hypothetical protein
MPASIGERIGHCRHGAFTYPSRMVGSVRSRRAGKFQIRRKSRRDRMQAKLQAIKQELRRNVHRPIPQQGRCLHQVVTGCFNYHAVPKNGPTLTAFLFHVTNLWRRTLRQRSQKDCRPGSASSGLADDWLPRPRILHPWPERRFAVRHPRWVPYARIGPVQICAGARGNSHPYRETWISSLPRAAVWRLADVLSILIDVCYWGGRT